MQQLLIGCVFAISTALLTSCANLYTKSEVSTETVEVVADATTSAPRKDHSGVYSLPRSDGGSCWLNILQKTLEELEFELLCMRGAPSYNSGYAMASIPMAFNVAVYSILYTDVECYIVFEFEQDVVNVTQIGRDFDCGFGGSVYATGTYQMVDENPPTLGCMRVNNPCGLTPDN